MTPFEFVLYCLAASGLIEVWFEGTLFDDLRTRVRAAAFADHVPVCLSPFCMTCWRHRLVSNVAYVFTCWYCLSYWVGISLGIWAAIGLPFLWLRPYLMFPIYAFAIARVVTLMNGLMPEWFQTKDIPPPISANPEVEEVTTP